MYRILRKLGRVVGRLVIAVHQQLFIKLHKGSLCERGIPRPSHFAHVVCCVHRERNLQFYTQEEMYMLCEHTCTVHVACTHDS